MSYNWKPVEGQDWSNRARYNIYRIMRENNIAASRDLIDGVSAKKIYCFLSGRQDISVSKLGCIADFLQVSIKTLFQQIPEHPEKLKMPYHLKQIPLPLEDLK